MEDGRFILEHQIEIISANQKKADRNWHQKRKDEKGDKKEKSCHAYPAVPSPRLSIFYARRKLELQ